MKTNTAVILETAMHKIPSWVYSERYDLILYVCLFYVNQYNFSLNGKFRLSSLSIVLSEINLFDVIIILLLLNNQPSIKFWLVF